MKTAMLILCGAVVGCFLGFWIGHRSASRFEVKEGERILRVDRRSGSTWVLRWEENAKRYEWKPVEEVSSPSTP